jgi:hypothetical protein
MSNRLKHVDDSTTNPFPVYSLEGLEWWLKQQPAEREYEFYRIDGSCLLHQYLFGRGEHGFGQLQGFVTAPAPVYGNMNMLAGTRPFTFGAALSRVRQALGRT